MNITRGPNDGDGPGRSFDERGEGVISAAIAVLPKTWLTRLDTHASTRKGRVSTPARPNRPAR